MEAIKAKARIGPGRQLTWLEPVPLLLEGQAEVILLYSQAAEETWEVMPVDHPQFGSAKGLIELADDFDAPLADFQEYMA